MIVKIYQRKKLPLFGKVIKTMSTIYSIDDMIIIRKFNHRLRKKIGHRIKFYASSPQFSVASIRDKDIIEFINILNDCCFSVADLRIIYRWVKCRCNFLNEPPFCSYKNLSHFWKIYEREQKHCFLLHKIITDLRLYIKNPNYFLNFIL